MHVHVACSDGDAKFWLEPKIEVALAKGLASHRLNEIRKIIEEHRNELTDAWRERLVLSSRNQTCSTPGLMYTFHDAV